MHNGRREPRRMRYSLESRLRIVRLIERGETPAQAASLCGASRATGYRLWRRYQAEGWQGLADRRSTPKHQPRRLSSAEEAEIVALRSALGAGPQVLAGILGRPASTVGKVLRRAGCSRLPRPEQPIRPRYERERPGELLHVDIKKHLPHQRTPSTSPRRLPTLVQPPPTPRLTRSPTTHQPRLERV